MFYDIKVGAITNAQRGAKILRYKGIKTSISRLSNPKAGDGCGFVLRVEAKDFDLALTSLKNNGIRVLGVVSL